MTRPLAAALLLLLSVAVSAVAQESAPAEGSAGPEPSIDWTVSPVEATVGDRISATLTLTVPEGTRFEPTQLGPTLGKFSVPEGDWAQPEVSEAGTVWRWEGALVAFRTGELKIPSIRLTLTGDDGSSTTVSTEPVEVRLVTVLDEAQSGEAQELADLKPPASIAPDYAAMYLALAILVLLLAAAGVAWWLQRRFADRFAAVPAPEDPFQRVPPHEWFYAELQRLLERRLAERGKADLFFEELARLVKRYLGGRFRVDLLEQTTSEVGERLREAAAPGTAIEKVVGLLETCDNVKFAKGAADSDECRNVVEVAYAIVDDTRPREAASAPREGAA
jgi:hypothetical protein